MKIGFCICGSFCTHKKALCALEALAAEHEIVPVLSFCAAKTDTRFGAASELTAAVTRICGREPVTTLTGAEPLGPAEPLDLLVICPCTGNTLSKLAHGVSDTPVTLAAKATLRADRPVLIALCSNDALGANLCNIGTLLNRKNFYFVPMYMDDAEKKPHSLVSDMSLLGTCLNDAARGAQVMPVFCRR
ncbi:MAG: dipicolinate synthase subunit B [Clostridia bacterium]|nr:dipicolinate synthase subunit B [Clostridia bacterium]